MKKSKVFLTAGAVVLAISAVFATKANKKFKTITTAFAASGHLIYAGGSSILTTKSGTGRALLNAELLTAAGGNVLSEVAMTTQPSGGLDVYFK